MNREPNGQLSPHGIMNRPLGDHVDTIRHEVALMLRDYMPSYESVRYALYYKQCLTMDRLQEWLARTHEYMLRYPSSQQSEQLRPRWHEVVEWMNE